MNKLILLIILFNFSSFAQFSFKVGSGSIFDLKMKDGTSSNLSIYVTESEFSKISIEYFFDTKNTLFGQAMWQQFQMQLTPKLIITAGYLQTSGMPKAETMTEDFFYVNSGVQLNDFLFQKEQEIQANKVGVEQVEVPAGSIQATHYRKENGGQVVDFWITDKAKPIGLIKLVSKGKKIHQNYELQLKNLGNNIKAKINPEQAVPLSKEGRAILNTKVD